jgi:hypothetical protein
MESNLNRRQEQPPPDTYGEIGSARAGGPMTAVERRSLYFAWYVTWPLLSVWITAKGVLVVPIVAMHAKFRLFC